MKSRLFAVLFVLALCTAAARAQAGIYIDVTGAKIDLSHADNGPFAFTGDGSSSATFKGATFGGYYDAPSAGAWKLGGDMRGRFIGGANGSRDKSLLVGVRIVYSNLGKLRPYIEPVAGLSSTHTGVNPRAIKRVEFGVVGGADYAIGKHVDWRVLEIGRTIFEPVNSHAFGATGTGDSAPKASTFLFSTGLVFRF